MPPPFRLHPPRPPTYTHMHTHAHTHTRTRTHTHNAHAQRGSATGTMVKVLVSSVAMCGVLCLAFAITGSAVADPPVVRVETGLLQGGSTVNGTYWKVELAHPLPFLSPFPFPSPSVSLLIPPLFQLHLIPPLPLRLNLAEIVLSLWQFAVIAPAGHSHCSHDGRCQPFYAAAATGQLDRSSQRDGSRTWLLPDTPQSGRPEGGRGGLPQPECVCAART